MHDPPGAVPATVVIVPSRLIRRATLLNESAMYRRPETSAAAAAGERHACVAGPPSPQNQAVPLPATVLMMPSAVTFRSRALTGSEMYRSPAGVSMIPSANTQPADAGPPSPVLAQTLGLPPGPGTTVCTTPSVVTLRSPPLPSAI